MCLRLISGALCRRLEKGSDSGRGSRTGAMRYRYAVEIDPRWGS